MVIPIHKGDSKTYAGNYRPISLLPILGKILEKLMYSRLLNFLQKHNIIVDNQFGFQKNKSTEDALLVLQTKITEAIENKRVACAIFLDFAKAFDTVNHEILVNKLEYYGIRGTPLDWIISYLTNRKQCVNINGIKSELKKVVHGVPQGSILGPLLFLLYINDIVKSSTKLEYLLFADDTSLLISGKTFKEIEKTLNSELENISNWLKANKLSLNVSKSNILRFSSGSNTQEPFNVSIDGKKIEEKDFVKYLGILIDKNLSFSEHISKLSMKLNKGNSILYKLRHFITEDKIEQVYYAHIHSHINYGIGVWCGTTKTNINKIQNKQTKSLNIMYFKNQLKLKQSHIPNVITTRNMNWSKNSGNFPTIMKNLHFWPISYITVHEKMENF